MFAHKLLLTFSVVLMASGLFASDWPQWMGPNRDNVWQEEGLLETFPEGGPKVVWRVPVAGGYSGPAVWNFGSQVGGTKLTSNKL